MLCHSVSITYVQEQTGRITTKTWREYDHHTSEVPYVVNMKVREHYYHKASKQPFHPLISFCFDFSEYRFKFKLLISEFYIKSLYSAALNNILTH